MATDVTDAGPVRVDPGSVRFCSLVDDEHGFTASFMRSFLPLIATDLGAAQRIWRGGYAFQQVTSSGVVEGRNEATKSFLDSEAEWLFFVDSDMGYDPDALERLIEAADPETRPVVGGLCFGYGPITDRIDHAQAVVKKPFPVIFNLERGDDDFGFRPQWHYVPGQIHSCDATGAALLLIHRSVLEEIRDRWGDVWFDRIKHPDAQKLWGEDTSFCYRVKHLLGRDVAVHTGVRSSHAKVVYVTETTFMNELVAPPATDEVAVIVPVLDRPQNAEPFMRSLRASTGLASVTAVCSTEHDAEAWEATGATVVRTDRVTFAEKVNEGYHKTTEPWVFIVGDDVTFRAGWLDQAQMVARNTGAKVIGTNDWGTERVMRGEHATHMLIARDYIEEVGASWDGPGVVCHEGYRHWYVDDEIVTAAKDRGMFAPSLASIVEHMHPLFGRGKDDETYRKGQAHADEDRATFTARIVRHVGFPGLVRDGFGSAQRDVQNGVYPPSLLGFEPFPGTLNLAIQRGVLAHLGEPDEKAVGPQCELWLWRASINGLDVWLMYPDRPPSVRNAEKVEVLAPVSLRELWGLSNGSRLQVKPRGGAA